MLFRSKFSLDVNAINRHDLTAFQLSCEHGHGWVVELLTKKSIEFNIDLNISNGTFQSACQKGYTKLVQILLQKPSKFGIKVNAKTRLSKETALHLALWNRHTEIAKIFIQKAAELNFHLTSKDKRGWTVFHLACYQGMKPIVEMMIKKIGRAHV